jgi:hypothetical protein
LDTDSAQNWVDMVIGLAADPAPSVIALGHCAVAWLNTNGHVARGFTAVLDASGFHLSRKFAEPTGMHEIHHRLLRIAKRHAVKLDRLHAYLADYDGPYDDLLADLRTEISPLKIEVRARCSPTTLTVATTAVPDPYDVSRAVPAAEAWITTAENAGFAIQGWGYHFPGCEAEDFTVNCAGAAIGYRWYALDVIDGTVTARETGTVAGHANLALQAPRRFGVLRRVWMKLTALLARLTVRGWS